MEFLRTKLVESQVSQKIEEMLGTGQLPEGWSLDGDFPILIILNIP